MVTHDPEEALVSADRIVLMRDGTAVQAGTPDDLYSRPVDAFTAAFFGAVNRVPGTAEGERNRDRSSGRSTIPALPTATGSRC